MGIGPAVEVDDCGNVDRGFGASVPGHLLWVRGGTDWHGARPWSGSLGPSWCARGEPLAQDRRDTWRIAAGTGVVNPPRVSSSG
jgi:hypothetical protein